MTPGENKIKSGGVLEISTATARDAVVAVILLRAHWYLNVGGIVGLHE